MVDGCQIGSYRLYVVLPTTSELQANTSWTDLAVPAFPVTSNAWSLVMLEAWRRGLKVEIGHNREHRISSAQQSLPFRMHRLTLPETNTAARICNSKHETKQYFQQHGLSTPAGQLFRAPVDKAEVLAAAEQLGYPLCLKAASWSKGKGVFPGITTKAQLSHFLTVLIDDLQCPAVIIEEHVIGQDFRFFVVGDRVSGVIQRVAANVEGDGVSTIAELIKQKNRLRSRNPYLKGALLHVDEEVEYMLRRQGYGLGSVLSDSEVLYLREKSNASAGGDSIDVTDLVSADSKQLAIDALKAIPGLSHGGVDLLIREPFTSHETATVIEINQTAEIGLHLYPAYGNATYPPADIIDHYFPETTRQPHAENWYFDLKSILAFLKNGVAKSVEVQPLPEIKNFGYQRITLTGDPHRAGFPDWVTTQITKLSLHGTCKLVADDEVELLAAGRKRNLQQLTEAIKVAFTADTLKINTVESVKSFRILPGFSFVSSHSNGPKRKISRGSRRKLLDLLPRVMRREQHQ